MALHDPEFNHRWIHSVTKTIDIGHNQLDIIRSQVRASIPKPRVVPLQTTPVVRRRRCSIFRFPGFLHS